MRAEAGFALIDAGHAEVEAVVRDSYGRLLAWLCTRTRDIASAEDALSGALLAALEKWPVDGIPAAPVAWLLTAARRRLLDDSRNESRRLAILEELAQLPHHSTPIEMEEFPDERIKLMLVCAHEALDSALHAALMLQTVLGLEASEIARAYVISPTTMAQQLVRAKQKLRVAGVSFDFPGPQRLAARLPALLAAIYAAYSTSWDAGVETDHRLAGLASEAVLLARVVVHALPTEPEARGLLALLLFSHARRAARFTAASEFVPLAEQNVSLWDNALIAEGDQHLVAAAASQSPGRFQLEAAIQSAHCDRRRTGETAWEAIIQLYDALLSREFRLGAAVSRAAAIAEAHGATAGLTALEALPSEHCRNYQPYWATRAHLLQRCGRMAEAAECFTTAIGMTEDPRVRGYLLRRQEGALNSQGDGR
jgi:RNA polymerase sigma-70 factor (ECF subfamily)